jgi:hypothetical protein
MRVGFVAVGLVLMAGSAWADSIDGAWCRTGARVVISGPSIVTASGAKLSGMYDRHGFSYVVPAGEPGAGGTMEMRLLGEYEMQSRIGAAGPVEEWRRCGPSTS